MEQDKNQTKQKIVTVGDSSSRELNYFYKNIIAGVSYDGGSHLAWACCDNAFNQEDAGGGLKRCKFCKKKSSSGNASAQRERDSIDNLFATAAFWGLLTSTGTLAAAQLSTSCPRLQKHSDSLASLSYGSHLDMIHPSLNPEVVSQVEEMKTTEEGAASRMRRAMAEKYNRRERGGGGAGDGDPGPDSDDDDHTYHPSVGDHAIAEVLDTDDDKSDVHPFVQAYAAGGFVNSLAFLSLTGGSLHAKGMKFKSDGNLKSTKGEINVLSERVSCVCDAKARLYLNGDGDDEEKPQRNNDTGGNGGEASQVIKH